MGNRWGWFWLVGSLMGVWVGEVAFGALVVKAQVPVPPLADGPRQNPLQPGEPQGFLVSVRREGGLCLPPGCISELMIFADGRYEYLNPPDPVVQGRIHGLELRLLKFRLSTTDFEAIRQGQPQQSVPGLCLLPMDGPEAVYTVWTGTGNGLPYENRFEQIRGCATAIDVHNPLFQQLERLYREISTQGAAPPVKSAVPGAIATATATTHHGPD